MWIEDLRILIHLRALNVNVRSTPAAVDAELRMRLSVTRRACDVTRQRESEGLGGGDLISDVWKMRELMQLGMVSFWVSKLPASSSYIVT